jgi:hypothetical protein
MDTVTDAELLELDAAAGAAAAAHEADPSTTGGYKLVYAREAPLELRLQTNEEAPQEIGTLEAILCKVLVQGDGAHPTSVKVELSSESDLFFHYTHQLDERSFRAVREEQRLMIDFQDYANVLARSLNLAIKEPHTHLAVFIMNRDGNARLDFIQNLEYKFVELLSVSFLQSAEAVIREHISFRYRAVREKLTLTQARLNEVTNIVSARARISLLFPAATRERARTRHARVRSRALTDSSS